jgi:hypothetical protein
MRSFVRFFLFSTRIQRTKSKQTALWADVKCSSRRPIHCTSRSVSRVSGPRAALCRPILCLRVPVLYWLKLIASFSSTAVFLIVSHQDGPLASTDFESQLDSYRARHPRFQLFYFNVRNKTEVCIEPLHKALIEYGLKEGAIRLNQSWVTFSGHVVTQRSVRPGVAPTDDVMQMGAQSGGLSAENAAVAVGLFHNWDLLLRYQ